MMRSNFAKKMVAGVSAVMLMGTALATPVSAATTVTEYKVDTDSNVMITQEHIAKVLKYCEGYKQNNRTNFTDVNWEPPSYHNCPYFVRYAFYQAGLPYESGKNPTYWARDDVWGIVSTRMDNIPVGAVVYWDGNVSGSNCGHIAICVGYNENGEAMCVGAGGRVVEYMPVWKYSKKYTNMTYKGWGSFGGYDMSIKPLPVPKLSITDKWLYDEVSVSCTDATQLDVVIVDSKTLKAKSYTILGNRGKLTIPDGRWTIKVRARVDGEYTDFSTGKKW